MLVSSLKPGDTVLGVVLGHVGVPRHEADGFADIGAGVDAVGLEELVVFIPKLGVGLFLQVVGFGEVNLSLGG